MSLSLCSWLLLAAPTPEAVWGPHPEGASQLLHGGPVFSLVFLPDGKTLISASGDRLIRLWDPATGKERRRLEGHTAAVLSLVLAPDGKRLASGSADGTVRFWDLAAGKEIRLIQGHRRDVTSLTFSPDGTQFASADVDLARVTSPYL
jgi:WD40 repeat protein